MQRFRSFFFSHQFNIIILFCGIILRLIHYLRKHSFDMDEAWLAIDISARSFQDIIHHKFLAVDLPVVPMGFALAEKSFGAILGYSEYAFRLFPFMCAIASFFLFYKVTKAYLDKIGVTIALAFFSLSNFLIYYSWDFKQYSTDLLMALILYSVVFSKKSDGRNHVLIYMFLGMVTLFFSYISAFILASIAFVQITSSIQERNPGRFKPLFFIYCFWIGSAVIFHWHAFYQMTNEETILKGASRFFIPYPVWSFNAVRWVGQAMASFFNDVVGISTPLGIIICFMGGVVICRNAKNKFLLLILPFIFALLGSALHKYPFHQRFLIFCVPAFFIFAARGIVLVINQKKSFFLFVSTVILFLSFLNPLTQTYHGLIHPRNSPMNREVITHFKEHYQLGDNLFLNHSAQYAYIFYIGSGHNPGTIDPIGEFSDRFFYDEKGNYIFRQEVIFSVNDKGFINRISKRFNFLQAYQQDHNAFGDNQRTWFLFSQEKPGLKKFVLDLAARDGVKISEFVQDGASLYLYDLSMKNIQERHPEN